jgi:hypothetical protein
MSVYDRSGINTVRLENCSMPCVFEIMHCTLPQPLPSKGGELKIPSPLVGEG